jgi:hypothetical protein
MVLVKNQFIVNTKQVPESEFLLNNNKEYSLKAQKNDSFLNKEKVTKLLYLAIYFECH